jgi:beta-aspartyl-peptidase (threonine type)
MIVVASSNGEIGIKESMRVLLAGGTALDAVEAGIRLVESNPEDHTVGYSGYPNILGEVELDASIMDGRSLTSGAVGALKGFAHPISIARKVMETLPHVFLAGEGAERFAAEMGSEKCDLRADDSLQEWEDRLRSKLPEGVFENLADQKDLWKWVRFATDPERAGGTVNFIAMDIKGDMCTGVSTSGWAAKYPGRLGDSPVIGAGSYAHNKYGAAACTGMGEMAIRASTARSVVLYMKMGLSLQDAGRMAMEDLDELGGKYLGRMSFIALDKGGQPGAFSNFDEATFIYMTDEMDDPVKEKRAFVETHSTWDRD